MSDALRREPVVIEMSDAAGRLLDSVLAYALDSPRWATREREAIAALRDGLRAAGVPRERY